MAYIDVDKLARKIRYIFKTYNVSKVITEKVNKALNDSTADVEEVKHGEWIDNEIQGSMLSKCSLCGYPCGAYTLNYCPHCGAKMDGGKKE